MSAFFGLTPQYRVALFTQIHQIVFYGKGGYDHDTVYDFPIWLRTFTYKKINEHYENEQEEYDKAKGKTKGGNVKVPSFANKTSRAS